MKCFTIFCDTARTFKTRRCCCHDAQSASPLSLQIFSGTRDVRRRRNVISLIARTLKWTLRRKSAAQPPPLRPLNTRAASLRTEHVTAQGVGCRRAQRHFCFLARRHNFTSVLSLPYVGDPWRARSLFISLTGSSPPPFFFKSRAPGYARNEQFCFVLFSAQSRLDRVASESWVEMHTFFTASNSDVDIKSCFFRVCLESIVAFGISEGFFCSFLFACSLVSPRSSFQLPTRRCAILPFHNRQAAPWLVP